VDVVQVRYRYRIEPTEVQRQWLARTFGCVRVVFNDAIRCRDDAYRSGERIDPTEVQRRVVTQAKNTDQRVWLSEVASVALVQSVRDADRAYRNFFDSVKGKRRGRAGMVRNRRLARAIGDAGWAQFVRLLQEKAERYGRTVHKIDRWHPSSKTCSACGHRLDTLSLRVRAWTCPSCAAVHDRDHNAASNILAAGQAERLTACGAQRSPSSGEVPGDEAGTTPDAA
jgi:transposase